MRRLLSVVVVVVAAIFAPAGAGAESVYTDECRNVCSDPTLPDQPLSPDPRSLATPEDGYTSTWQDCHRSSSVPRRPATCREWCAARDRGKRLIETQGLIGSFLDARIYNDLWKAWGEPERPENFDQRIVDRYGLQPSPFDNPYPRPDGSTGQLPMGLIQTRGANGKHNGGIGFTCLLCHGGRIGDETDVVNGVPLGSRIGIGNTTFDIEVFSVDLGKAGGTPIPLPYPHNEGRGTINAVSDFEFLMVVRDFDTLDNTPFVKTFPAHPSPGDQDPPAWHNTGSRPRVYMDGGVSSDNTRALMQFLTASINFSDDRSENRQGSGAWIKKQEAEFEDIRVFIDSIEPPPYPRATDTELEAEGERLFHEENLFKNRPGGPPFGNGSCSSCHGVYSTNYASLLKSPRLVGIAGQIVQRNTVLTDPARVDALHPELRWGWGTLWFAYADNAAKDEDRWAREFNEAMNDFVSSDTNGQFYTREQGECGWIAVDAYGNVEQKLVGYAAPALHGVWSTAPYFHNGSVPTVYDVLRYGERPRYWRRPLRTPGSGPDQGFDVTLAAYDFGTPEKFGKLGWKYDHLDCDGVPLVQCSPDMPLTRRETAAVANLPGSQVWLANQSPRPTTQVEIDARKIYDTTRYGRSNEGHWWTSRTTLSENQVEALLEYLKTL